MTMIHYVLNLKMVIKYLEILKTTSCFSMIHQMKMLLTNTRHLQVNMKKHIETLEMNQKQWLKHNWLKYYINISYIYTYIYKGDEVTRCCKYVRCKYVRCKYVRCKYVSVTVVSVSM